jgi:outer membrane protein OmpA-like peptidoglycan-associated protein
MTFQSDTKIHLKEFFLRCLVIACLLTGLLPAAFAQTQPETQLEVRQMLALTFREGHTVSLKLQGTRRLPKANGEAKVERKKGATEIEIELDEMKPASLFGGDFNTYVLWSVSPEGYASNLGEFVLQGNRSKLNVSTQLETFGLCITAEPHYLVRTPSRFVILENTRPTGEIQGLKQTAQVQYHGYEGVYKADRESIAQAPEASGEIRSELGQARVAVSLAERAQAQQYALEKLTEARVYLRRAEEAAAGNVDKKTLANVARAAIRSAYDAQVQAEEGVARAKAEAERLAREAKEAKLSDEARQAEARQKAEEEARQRAEAQQLAAEKQKMEAELAAAREAKARAEAESEERAAKEAAERARLGEEAARAAAEKAERDRQALRSQLLEQFNRILETHDTPRGLVVNMADVLFDTGKYNLRPAAREKLAKLSGIVLAHPNLKLEVEGYTDNVGGEAYNQKLSEKRAETVQSYLVEQGLDAGSVTAKGLGETMPIAGNESAKGRQQNRRVEIIVSGEVIGSKIGSARP